MSAIIARHYEKLEKGKVHCHLCPAECKIADHHKGICNIRTNEDGVLWASEYGNTIALNLDPIEKKPLYHFKPGRQILSIGPNGCNFACVFCQNWTISQMPAGSTHISPEELTKMASSNDSIGVAYTYTEPLVWFEYVYDSAKLLKEKGLCTVLVTNGYINEGPARELFQFIDAANIDLKSINPDFYRKICKGKLEDVQRTIIIAREMGLHIELTNLLIPELNDSDEDISRLVEWCRDFDESVPLHFSRYFPHYKLETAATPLERMESAYKIGREKLKYVYVGNVSGIGSSDTICSNCGNVLIKREFYQTQTVGLYGSRCRNCGAAADIFL
jgi:pyruvate formate lyase activating enzyme